MKQEIILTEEGIKEVCKEARTRFLGNIEHIVDLSCRKRMRIKSGD
ncbi:MAG: hypothetical protein ACLRRB_01195 [Ruminococcus sp.]